METAVSEFFSMTCVVHPQPNENRWRGIRQLLTNAKGVDGSDITHITVCTPSGSASEFYIDPMLPLIGDIDTMWHTSNKLVVPQGHHVTDYVQLPVEFHTSDEIKLYEFIETEFPGYVFIRLIGKLIKNGKSDKYKFVRATERSYYTMTNFSNENERHGPARVYVDDVVTRGRRYEIVLSSDRVQCLRCLQWPPQAAEWSTRHRKYGCPDTATIQSIVNNGCDLVQTTHRQCKQNERYRERMWRI